MKQTNIWTFVQRLLHTLVSRVAQVKLITSIRPYSVQLKGVHLASATSHMWLLKLHVQLAQAVSRESNSCKTLLLEQDRHSTWLPSCMGPLIFACSTMWGGTSSGLWLERWHVIVI